MNLTPRARFTGIFIPVEILRLKDIITAERMLLSIVDAYYDESKGGCWASNKHLGDMIDMKPNTVAKSLTKLRKLGYIEDVEFDGQTRIIRAKIGAILEKSQSKGGVGLKSKGGLDYNPSPSYIYIKEDIKEDNVCTMSYSKEKVDNSKARFLNKLTKEQRELHDKILKYKPNWGDPPKSEEVCAWFLAKKYTLTQVVTALNIYHQDANDAKAKGRTIDNMGGYVVSAIKNQRAPKNQDFEANKQMAKATCKDFHEMRVLDKYVSYCIGSDEIQIMYNLPIETFTEQLGSAKRKLLMER